jgi:hypothetical protein
VDGDENLEHHKGFSSACSAIVQTLIHRFDMEDATLDCGQGDTAMRNVDNTRDRFALYGTYERIRQPDIPYANHDIPRTRSNPFDIKDRCNTVAQVCFYLVLFVDGGGVLATVEWVEQYWVWQHESEHDFV